jgi:hypothetical protein
VACRKKPRTFPPVLRFFDEQGQDSFEIRLSPGGRIEGRAHWSSGRPCSCLAVHVHAMGDDGRLSTCFGSCASADREGCFTSGNIHPGKYRLVILETGNGPFHGPVVIVEPGKTLRVKVEVPEPDEGK